MIAEAYPEDAAVSPCFLDIEDAILAKIVKAVPTTDEGRRGWLQHTRTHPSFEAFFAEFGVETLLASVAASIGADAA